MSISTLFEVKILITLLWTLLTSQAIAQNTMKEKILTLTNLDERTQFALHIDKDEEQRATGLALYDPNDKSWTEYDVSKLKRGIPVKKEGSHEVIVLKSDDFESDRGGHFKVDYLKNGITGSRGALALKFDFDGHKWRIYYRGSQVSALHFKLNKVFGKAVGIKQVLVK